MKKIITSIGLVLIICTAFNHPNDTFESDYRDTYTGIYFCNRFCNVGIGSQHSSSTDTISINITKGEGDSLLQFTIGDQVLTVKLIKNILQAYPKHGHYGGKFFALDSIDFVFMGGRASSCRYKGKKRS